MQNKHTEAYVTGKKVQAIKKHVQENQPMYIVGGTCLGIGFIGGLLARRPIQVNVTIQGK
jgi:hypothetical protein